MKTIRSALVVLLTATSSFAIPPNADRRGFQEGANHHLGDESFVATFGRAPRQGDAEEVRMRTHLAYVHDRLAKGTPTRPELASARARVVAALGDYIARGKTPKNLHLPWRNPVFTDDDGTICAVGYLIEETAGPPLARKIAAEHRYDFIEDIVAEMPDVAAWVASSGLSLEEVASIQPGYERPVVETYRPWSFGKEGVPEGAFDRTVSGVETRGQVRAGRMEGDWTTLDAEARVLGRGTFRAGRGTWTSFRPGGERMAEGDFEENRPQGAWRFFHPSGRLAAEGRFARGIREGRWSFFYDASPGTPIATGSFQNGRVAGTWRHFDADGHLLAVSRDATPAQWTARGAYTAGGYLLDILPGLDNVRHWVHEGDLDGDAMRLDLFARGKELLYARFAAAPDEVYDAGGHKLRRTQGGWASSACDFSPQVLRATRAGDLETLDDRTFGRESCGAETAVPPARARRLDTMLASMRAIRAMSPDFVRQLTLGEAEAEDAEASGKAKDTAEVLAANMSWYIEWPHVDGQFIALFRTLPGYSSAPEET